MFSRRALLKALPLLAVSRSVTVAAGTVGYLHATGFDHSRESVRVWIDGEEVTNDCFEADDIAGYVGLYHLDDGGRKYLNPARDGIATYRRAGHVRIERKPRTS